MFTVTWLCNLRCRFYLRVHSFGMIQIRISDLWHFFWCKSLFRSLIHWIHSGIHQISDLDDLKLVIGSLICYIPLACHSALWFLLRASQVHYIWKQICHFSHALSVLNFIEVSSCNLALFLPVLAKIEKKLCLLIKVRYNLFVCCSNVLLF